MLFTIGAHVKNILRGNVSDILYTELPNPDDLMDLVEVHTFAFPRTSDTVRCLQGIYIARKEEYVGHLKVRRYKCRYARIEWAHLGRSPAL